VNATADIAACRGCHCLAARRYARAITRLFEQKLRPHRLRATQFSVLAVLALKGPTPVAELADILGLERTTLTRVGRVLERRGWLGSARSKDARRRPMQLTPAGRRKLEAAFPAWKQAQDLVDSRLSGHIGEVDRLIAELPPRLGRDRT
jgi:DNA-binding MarR family transcriptional regulator